MAGKNKKTESDFIKELEALEQQKKEATEQLKAYLKSQTDKLGQIYFELKKLENPDISIDDLVVEEKQTVNSKNDIGELKDKEITQRVILAPSSTPETVDTQNIQAPNQEFELPQELSRVAREKATRTLESNVEQMDIDEEEGF